MKNKLIASLLVSVFCVGFKVVRAETKVFTAPDKTEFKLQKVASGGTRFFVRYDVYKGWSEIYSTDGTIKNVVPLSKNNCLVLEIDRENKAIVKRLYDPTGGRKTYWGFKSMGEHPVGSVLYTKNKSVYLRYPNKKLYRWYQAKWNLEGQKPPSTKKY